MSEKSQIGDRGKHSGRLGQPLEPIRPTQHAPHAGSGHWRKPGRPQPVKTLKMVFHVHTNYSDDGNMSPQALLAEADRRQVTCLTVTDHDTMDGARHVADIAPRHIRIIQGQEVSTAEGHLIGLFLQEEIPAGLSPLDTAERIRDQGGLVIVPHPFNTMFDCSLKSAIHDLGGLIDAVEIFNAQNVSPLPNRKAAAFARDHHLPAIVGGDVHHRGYLDSTYQWIPAFTDARSFMKSLQSAHFVARRHPLSYFVRSANVFGRGLLNWRTSTDYGANCDRSRSRRTPASPALPAGQQVLPTE